MNDFEIISYQKTPNSDKMLGFITGLINKVVIVRFKICTAKNGGFYIQSPSFKAPNAQGDEAWFEGVSFDSKICQEMIHGKIRAYIAGNASPSALEARQGHNASQETTYNGYGQKTSQEPLNDEMPF